MIYIYVCICLTMTLVSERAVKLEGVMVGVSSPTLLRLAGKWLPLKLIPALKKQS